MKVPDKIYLAENDKKAGEINISFWSLTPFSNHRSIKYIRKDALLEWLEVLKAQSLELREKGYGDVFYGAQIAILEEVINKLNKM